MASTPIIGGSHFRTPESVHSNFEDAHEVLDIAEAEIKRLYAIIEKMPDNDKETRRLLRIVAEAVRGDGAHTLTDAQVEELRTWYFSDRRMRI
jgi:hypothetical protein